MRSLQVVISTAADRPVKWDSRFNVPGSGFGVYAHLEKRHRV